VTAVLLGDQLERLRVRHRPPLGLENHDAEGNQNDRPGTDDADASGRVSYG